jgi:radical SAM superfamily enzyme YgiQ (UPF0313 family)
MLAAITPDDVEIRFYDDRLETIPFDEPTDLVAISVETYTAKRAYQIASEYRVRGVPVVMGGFHATLCAAEVAEYCDSLVIGEAEELFPALIEDYRQGRPKAVYQSDTRPSHLGFSPDRSIFVGKRYLPISLVEFSRGCKFVCDFCAIQSAYDASHRCRPVENVIEEVKRIKKRGRMIFFIDDNLTSNMDAAKQLMRQLIPLKIRWVSQCDISVAYDQEALELMKRSGCQGVLVGFESLDRSTLKAMNKGFNMMQGGPVEAIANFQHHGLRLYGTFIFGNDYDTEATFRETLHFAIDHGLFIAAFNHITPFPGTPLYQRLEQEGRLLYSRWWLDDAYRYGDVPFRPKNIEPAELARLCIETRKAFYSWKGISQRMLHPVNHRDPWMLVNYLAINLMHQFDVSNRDGLPLGNEDWAGHLIKTDKQLNVA